ncbi:family 16 glycoside hydrolase [Aquirufa aurantiipilula]
MKQKTLISRLLGFSCLFIQVGLFAQKEPVSFQDLNFWKVSGKNNWQIAGQVSADLNKKEHMATQPGQGILVNLPEPQNRANLISVKEFGDMDVEFDFMMASHSNSGFYLQGRYEVQLMDSWGVQNPSTGDCGGIYKRRKFIPQEYLYEGHAPRVNACLAPGLWQHMEISFQAPKFDAQGNKISHAKVLFIKLNGFILHENVELSGPTGGPISEKEVARGPIMIQGDHGAVAFKNLKIKDFDGQAASLSPVNYQVYYGKFKSPKDFINKKPNASGTQAQLAWNASKNNDEFAVIYAANINVPKAGKHNIELISAGNYTLQVNGQMIASDTLYSNRRKKNVEVELPAGNSAIKITYYKADADMSPMLGLGIEGPNFRMVNFQHPSSTLILGNGPSDIILMDAPKPTLLRSFVDIQQNGARKRLVHSVNVGNPAHLHYTYDLDNGAIAQIWKGDFLDTTPMWDNRGDGSSRPRGPVLNLGSSPLVVKNSELEKDSDSMSESAGFKIGGYEVDDHELPTFEYEIWGSQVRDEIRVIENKYLQRTLSIKKPNADASLKLVSAKLIQSLGNDLYAIDGQSYYIQAAQASVRTSSTGQILVLPLAEKITYSILW